MKLLENNNRKFIRTLSGNCLKANKSRNGIAVLAIILTAILFMSLTTVLEGVGISMRTQALRQAGSKFMVSVKNLTQEEAERLVSESDFTIAGIERYVSMAVNSELNNVQAVIGWVDHAMMENSFMHLEKGHYPEQEDEIACDSEILRLLGLPNETGCTFTLEYTAGEELLKRQMTVCGIWEGMKYEQSAALLVSESFVEEVLAKCDGKFASLRETSYDVRGSFSSDKNLSWQLDQMVEKMGYNPSAEWGEEGFLIHHVNPAYESGTIAEMGTTYIIEGIGVLLILFAGYLIIYNIFKISVEKDIRLYGQLKTIGTSPEQIRYMVIRQGTLLSIAGIPAGLILGWLLGNALLPLLMSSLMTNESYFIVPSVWVWLFSGFFTWFTVRISCSKPGKIAGKLSPVEAVKYHRAQYITRKRKRGMGSKHRIVLMAVGNLSRNKGKTALVVLSISFSAVMLNSALNYTECMDLETYVRHDIVTDFNVQSADYFKYAMENAGKVVAKKNVEVLRILEGVKDFGLTYCYMLPDEELTERREDLAEIKNINQKKMPEDDSDSKVMLFGFDESALSHVQVIEGSIDYEKLCTENYVIMAGFLSDRGEYHYEAQRFHAGDVIEAEIGGTVQEYTVMAVAGVPNSMLMSYSSGGYEVIAFAEPVFLKMFPAMQSPVHCLFNAEEGMFDELNEQIGAIAEYNGLSVQTRLTAEEHFKGIQSTFSMVGIVISLILGVIGILNLVNVILTGVIARQREFASMRSIGMTKMQLQKMVVYEGIFYAALAGVTGILISGVLSVTLVKGMAVNMWFMQYQFTVIPAVITAVICLLLAACISAMTDKIWNKGSIVE